MLQGLLVPDADLDVVLDGGQDRLLAVEAARPVLLRDQLLEHLVRTPATNAIQLRQNVMK